MGVRDWFEDLFDRVDKYKAFYHKTKAEYMKKYDDWVAKRKRKKRR